MRDASFASKNLLPAGVLRLSARQRLAMVLLGYIPLLHVATVLAVIVPPSIGVGSWRLAALAPVVLYLVPPFVVRIATAWHPLQDGCYSLQSREFLWWWFTAQWQVVFNRLPMFEELLRLAPGLYSAWLRLWGARIGALVYWSPGVEILDRPLITVGSRAVLGVGARLCPHLISRGGRDEATLLLGRVELGADCLIGGLAALLPGVRVHDGEELRGARPVAPFTEFRQGRSIRQRQQLAADESLLPTLTDAP